MTRTAEKACLLSQSWRHLLFAHWEADPIVLAGKLPEGLSLDLIHGKAWVGAVCFLTEDIRLLGALPVPFFAPFAQLNVRTYVTHLGEKGVYFLSLEASSAAAALGARLAYGLAFSAADAEVVEHPEDVEFTSRRGRGSSRLDYACRYRPVGPASRPRQGTVDHEHLERYVAFSASSSGALTRADLEHEPWRVHQAEASYTANTISGALGLRLAPTAPRLLYAERKVARVGPPLSAD